jgi:streptogramin lyase
MNACGGGSSGTGQSQGSMASSVNVGSSAVGSVLPPVSATATPAAHAAAPSPVPVHLTYHLPPSLTTSAAATQALGERALKYISPSNTLISIAVTPLNGSTTNYGPTACTTSSCAVSFTALPGANTLSFTLTDGSSNVLSKFSTITVVHPSGLNTLSFSANPIVSSVSLTLASATENAGTAADDLLTVNAKDADGNTILGSNYTDANGSPVALTLSVNNTQAGGRGTVLLQGPTWINGATHAAISAHYDGGWLDHATISVSANSSLVSTASTATLSTVPYAVEYTVAGNPGGITVGPDGNLWFPEYGTTAIGKISTSGTGYIAYSCGACSQPSYIVAGSDGNLWFTEDGGRFIDKMTPTGVSTRVVSTPQNAMGITVRADGNIWYSYYGSGGGVGSVSTQGVQHNYANAGNIRTVGAGPDGNLWYLNTTSNVVGKITPTGTYLSTYTVANMTDANGFNGDTMTIGPDGNIWFPNWGSALIEKVTPSGTVTGYALQAGADPSAVAVGPDGNIWVTETGTGTIARVGVNGTPLTEYGTANGITAGASPYGITTGPDGNIWFTEFSTNKIAKFIL